MKRKGIFTGLFSSNKFNQSVRGESVEQDDVIDAEVEVAKTTKYTGVVVTSKDGYSFIGRVKRGFETINTNGDVFCPKALPEGANVEFDQLNEDAERSTDVVKKFRTEDAKVLDPQAMIMVGGVSQPQAVVIRKLTERAIYHATAKEIDPQEAEKAAENVPFEDMLGLYAALAKDGGPQRLIEDMASEYLRGTYANLSTLVNYSVSEPIDKDAEAEMVAQAKKGYAENGLDSLIPVIEREYEAFGGLREAFRLMHSIGLLRIENVIPIRHLPDLLVVAPVWFVHSKHGVEDLTGMDDPRPDHAVQFFCDCVGTKEFAWLYQIYNRRTRPLNQYNGRDSLPTPLLNILKVAKETFDYVVICTPYHDLASKEWADPNWLRNLDPFLFGFIKGLPHMFLLGRWSGTGLFPLVCDMIADTMDHLSLHKNLLARFPANAYWYKGNYTASSRDNYLENDVSDNNLVLVPFAERVLRAYEERRLFEFLRGEKPEDKDDAEN